MLSVPVCTNIIILPTFVLSTETTGIIWQSCSNASDHGVGNKKHPSRLTEALKESDEGIREYLCNAIFQIICDIIGPKYPLIFSPEYTAQLAEYTRYIPLIARSIQKMVVQKDTPEKPSETSQIASATIEAIKSKTRILRPGPANVMDDDVWTTLVVGLYDNFKQNLTVPKLEKVCLNVYSCVHEITHSA
ncbi:hypothetical protein BJV82DRAFT_301779 [Fennellomyces sp. T-0311]|nr:hypothetical protein BJV82DRAFT_301779 [Fennellomyces sp. T-0311]